MMRTRSGPENSTADWFDAFLEDDPTAFKRLAVDANVPGAASLRSAGLR